MINLGRFEAKPFLTVVDNRLRSRRRLTVEAPGERYLERHVCVLVAGQLVGGRAPEHLRDLSVKWACGNRDTNQ